MEFCSLLPKILALAKVNSEDNEDVAAIKEEINKEHQYWTDYTDVNSMKYIFESILNWDLIDVFQKLLWYGNQRMQI